MRRSSSARRFWDPRSLRGCVLYLPFYKYGANAQKIWDMSVQNLGPTLVTNGGMETGDPPTWWGSVNTPETFERSGVQKHSGSYSCHVVDNPASWAGLVNSTTSAMRYAGKRYKVSFWYYLVSGSLSFIQKNGGGSADIINTTLTTTGSWQYYEGVFTETTTGQSVNNHWFVNSSNSVAAEFYIDDVAIQEVDYNSGVSHGTITGAVPAQIPILSNVELISNGGMETGNPPTGWTDDGTPEVFERSGVQKHGGSYSAHVNDSIASYGGIYQGNLPLTAGKTYKVSLWYYIVSGTIWPFVVYNGGESCRAGASSTTGSWLYAEQVFVSTGSPAYIKSYNTSNTVAAEFYIDDVSIREVVGYESLGWQFDGVDDVVTVPHGPSFAFNDNITILYWRNLSNMGIPNQNLIKKNTNITDTTFVSYETLQTDGTLITVWYATVGGVWTQVSSMSTGVMRPNQWNCIGWTYENGGTLYVDGAIVGEKVGAGTLHMNAEDIKIGLWVPNTNALVGIVGEVLIFDRVLSVAEIKNYYEATRGRYGV